MLLSELIDIVITETGQFILGDDSSTVLDCTNINRTRFWNIARRSLKIYQKHFPVSKQLSIEVTQRVFEFGVGTNPIATPDWISSAIPTGLTGGIFLTELLFRRNSDLEPRTSLWTYRKPKLYTTEDGFMDITAHYPYTTNETLVDEKLSEVDIVEISEADNLFIDLVTANFMIALGRSRRQFNIQELPIQIDASELTDEGKELLEQTNEKLLVKSRWWESVGA